MIMTDELPEKCCFNCKWWVPRDGSVLGFGACEYPLSMLPASIQYHNRRVPMNGIDGTTCPCFEPKEKP